MLTRSINLVPDPCRWTLTRANHRADVVYAFGTGPTFPEAFAAGLAATNRFTNWGDIDFDDPVWVIGAQWADHVGPVAISVDGFLLTTETVA